MRRRVPLYITTVVGFFVVAKFFLNIPIIENIANELEQWAMVVVAFAIVLGVANIIRINLLGIIRRRPDWQYKVVLLATMFITTVSGLIIFIQGKDLAGENLFNWIFMNVYTPLGTTVYALLAFFIASAAFRAFRARNLPATFMLSSAVLVMIGRVPLGAAISSIFPNLANWIMSVPNTAGQRGIIIGAAIGVIGVGLKIITGIERPYLRGE
ncbi:hypothetical protein J7M23_12895 [Candidatus Sumerlaeota bacterium]|nr:hypothetical protein [Candidatus Sumerlaeota bacterium]